jgi:hypothetical protein
MIIEIEIDTDSLSGPQRTQGLKLLCAFQPCSGYTDPAAGPSPQILQHHVEDQGLGMSTIDCRETDLSCIDSSTMWYLSIFESGADPIECWFGLNRQPEHSHTQKRQCPE